MKHFIKITLNLIIKILMLKMYTNYKIYSELRVGDLIIGAYVDKFCIYHHKKSG